MAYTIGQTIEVTISAIQPYGAFAVIDDNYTGLIHISEISSKFVKSIDSFVTLGSKIKVKILEIDEDTKHIKLSLKALRRSREEKKYYNKVAYIKNAPQEVNMIMSNMSNWISKTLNEKNFCE